MEDYICRVCLQTADRVHLTRRNLSAFYAVCAMSVEEHQRATSVWVCVYCWKLTSQCLRIIQLARRTDILLRKSNTQSSLSISKNAKLYPYRTTSIHHTTVCNSNYCDTLPVLDKAMERENIFYIQCENREQQIGNLHASPEHCYIPEPIIKPDREDEIFCSVKHENLESLEVIKTEPGIGIQVEIEKLGDTEHNAKKFEDNSRRMRNKNILCLGNLSKSKGSIKRKAKISKSKSNLFRSKEIFSNNKDNHPKSKATDDERANVLGYEVVVYNKEQQIEEIEKKKQNRRFANSIYKCNECGLGYQSQPVYKAHILKRHVEAAGPYVCSICHYRYVTRGLLTQHITDEHERKWRCTRCATIVIRQMWSRHRDDCTADSIQYECEICNKKCRSKFYLQRHKNIIHNTKKQFACEYCSKSFKYKSELEIHVRRHTGEKPYECVHCDMKFISMFQYRIHLNSRHSEGVSSEPLEERYCVECDRYYKTKNLLEKHLLISRKHVSPETYKHACEICTKRFPMRKHMERHMKAVHLKIKEFSCSQCDKAFVAVGTLKKHIKKIHNHEASIEQPRCFVCDVCGAAFKAKPTLKNHVVAVHEKLRPYECKICGATFGFQGSLHTHIKLKHKGEKRNRKNTIVASTPIM